MCGGDVGGGGNKRRQYKLDHQYVLYAAPWRFTFIRQSEIHGK